MQVRFRSAFAVVLTAIVTTSQILAPARADDTARFIQIIKPMLAVTSYRMRMTTNLHGKTQTRTMLFVAPDRLSSSGSGIDLISIGNKAWMRMPGSSTWSPSPVAMGSIIAQYRDPAKLAQLTAGTHTNYSDAGVGSYQGQPAHLFKSTSSIEGRTSHTTLYVLGDGLIHHMDIAGPSGTTTTIDFSDFNSKSISIQPPA